MEHTPHKLERDEWRRPECYMAEWNNGIGGSRCLFSRLDAAIFFVITGLGNYCDWNNFPDPTKRYPYEDRDGSNHGLNPVFIVKQTNSSGKEISGSVIKMAIADDWTVGNGIAEMSRKLFREVTGRDPVHLKGVGDKLTATVNK
jgi:hypothetical protein